MSRGWRKLPVNRIQAILAASFSLVTLGTMLGSAATFSAVAVHDGRPHFDACSAVQLGVILVAAAASAIQRPAFFAFAGATAVGGAIGIASPPFGVAGLVFSACSS